MFTGGRYVRAPEFQSDSEKLDEVPSSASDYEGREKQLHEVGFGENETCGSELNGSDESTSETGDDERLSAHQGVELSAMRNENREYYERMKQMEATLNQLVKALDSNQSINGPNKPPGEVDHSWSIGSVVPGPSSSSSNIRWENIQPFPNNIPANKMWEHWHRFVDRFEIAMSLGNINDPVKLAQGLFISMGEKLQGIILAARLRPSLNEPNCYAVFVKNVEDYLRSMVDVTAEHEAFTNLKQYMDEPTLAFQARLMEKVRLCGYSRDDQNRFVRAQLLKGMRNKDLAKTARTFGYETTFIVQSATREEAYTAETMQPDSSQAFAVTRNRQRAYDQQQWKRKHEIPNKDGNQRKKRDGHDNRYRGPGRRSRCSKCDKPFHKFGSCTAINNNCNNCGKRGHFAVVCWNKAANNVQVDRSQPREENMKILGADVNTIGGDDWKRLEHEFHVGTAKLEPIQLPNDSAVHSYASIKPISVTHAFTAEVEVVGCHKPLVNAEFLVIDKGSRSLLGRSTASDLKLLKVGIAVNNCETSEQLSTFPKVPGVQVKFSVDKAIAPTKNAYFNVPAAYRESAKARLTEMENRGIIERVTTAPEWSMSVVAKGKGDFRLVVNMRAQNRAIKREYYRLPLLDEMKVKLYGANYFSKLDLTNAFYHLELHESSRDLTTFMSENGMFRFTRLMFGVNCAPEIFQREMSRILESVKNIIVYIDDILIFAKTLEELRKTTAQVLMILKENNLTVNSDKCEYDRTRIKFLGHELDKNGFNIDEAKVRHIERFRQPNTISELRSFLGFASFLSPYIQGFANITRPLWELTSCNIWTWSDEQTKAFEHLKNQIAQCTVSLGYFSSTEKTILYTDASPHALGAVLVQDDGRKPPRVISFASKALTMTEKKYPQIQREALAAVWAVEYFAYFLLGRHFTLRTDAQGFTFILNRLREDSKRALNRADENIADSSSRLYVGNDAPFEEGTSPWEIAALEVNQVRFLTEEEIRLATVDDVQLKKVVDALETGYWPKELKRFEMLADDFTILRQKTLEIAHEGHPATAKFKSILRERVWYGVEYKQYCRERGINTIFSTPLYPQQNGLAESCMKLINKAMTAAASTGANYREELKAAIHAYNAAAHSVTGVPPEEDGEKNQAWAAPSASRESFI
ncbi:uncharacterized protein K02A2.6-like [Toxorhynchites rutilus septentrionalis]|uniref:uncharacterized protein K02A2.6-like n=1 Tax=Toxorhynchites rutilus septentrionalis TaxID=329112 RepID=UPI002479F269|nr:uncharacterized protein K02A2.6-like [Toxorhynchites rutilus septentrionalis]